MKEVDAVLYTPAEKPRWLSIHSLTLLALLIGSEFLGPGHIYIGSIVYLFLHILSKRLFVSKEIIKIFFIPVLLIYIGLLGFSSNPRYLALKDGWYYSNLIVPILLGYLFATKTDLFKTILPVFIICAVVASGLHVMKFVKNPVEQFAMVADIRTEYGAGTFLSVIGVSVILLSKYYSIRLFRRKLFENAAFLLCFASLILSFSRTYWISTIIMVFMGMISLKRMKYILLFGCFLVGFFLFFKSNLVSLDIRNGTISYKLSHALEEIVPSDYYAKRDINANWRGYETFHVLQTYMDGSLFNLVLGHGFGKLADMKIFMLLGSEKFRYTPIFHNGYVYVLLKTGIIGLLLYLLYIIKFIRLGLRLANAPNVQNLFAGRIVAGLGVVFFFTTFAIGGMFNKGVLFSATVLLGGMMGFLEKKKNEKDSIERKYNEEN